MTAGSLRRLAASPRFARFARSSVLVIVMAVIVGAFAPGTGRAAEPDVRARETTPVYGLTTTTFGLPVLDLAAAQESVAPQIEEVATVILRSHKVAARLAGERTRWQATLDRDISDLMGVVADFGVEAEPVNASASVDGLFAVAMTRAESVNGLLDKVIAAADVLDRHAAKAARVGVDVDLYHDAAVAARVWEQAQRRAADPYLCSSVLPDGAGEWPASRLGDYLPYLDCLGERITPRVEAVVEAGRALNESLAELTS